MERTGDASAWSGRFEACLGEHPALVPASRQTVVAVNNAEWCDVVCETQGAQTRVDVDAWTSDVYAARVPGCRHPGSSSVGSRVAGPDRYVGGAAPSRTAARSARPDRLWLPGAVRRPVDRPSRQSSPATPSLARFSNRGAREWSAFPTSSPMTPTVRRAGQAALPGRHALSGIHLRRLRSRLDALAQREPMASNPWVPYRRGSAQTERSVRTAVLVSADLPDGPLEGTQQLCCRG